MALAAVFVDADTFTVATDYTASFVTNRKVRCDCGVDGYKYCVVLSSAYGAPNTTVELTADSDDITANLVSVKWSVVAVGAAGNIPLHDHSDEDSGSRIDWDRWTAAEDAGVVLTLADAGKTITVNAAGDQVVSLPSVAAGDIGTWFCIVKLGAGKVTIDAADSDTIADSGAGDTIYNSCADETYATITLQLVSATQWEVTGGHGTWVTTD